MTRLYNFLSETTLAALLLDIQDQHRKLAENISVHSVFWDGTNYSALISWMEEDLETHRIAREKREKTKGMNPIA